MLIIALAIARSWTCLYTCWMDRALRDRRRAEIESDLWEYEADAYAWGERRVVLAAGILGRVIAGVPDDVLWRLEHSPARSSHRSLWISAAASAALLAALWAASSWSRVTRPRRLATRFRCSPRHPLRLRHLHHLHRRLLAIDSNGKTMPTHLFTSTLLVAAMLTSAAQHLRRDRRLQRAPPSKWRPSNQTAHAPACPSWA
jgi:hypothetical protein